MPRSAPGSLASPGMERTLRRKPHAYGSLPTRRSGTLRAGPGPLGDRRAQAYCATARAGA
eukprot:506517-Lingulodinium_polyedra.AAC.1